jgi:hypothetical protein
MIISCDFLNSSLENEYRYVGDVTIPTQVIKYNQNFLQSDQPIRLQYSNQIKSFKDGGASSFAHVLNVLSVSVTYDRSVVFSGYSSFLLQ